MRRALLFSVFYGTSKLFDVELPSSSAMQVVEACHRPTRSPHCCVLAGNNTVVAPYRKERDTHTQYINIKIKRQEKKIRDDLAASQLLRLVFASKRFRVRVSSSSSSSPS